MFLISCQRPIKLISVQQNFSEDLRQMKMPFSRCLSKRLSWTLRKKLSHY